MYQSHVSLSLSQERKWLKCILTSASTDCGRRGSTRSSWTTKICCDPETLRAWVLADRTPPSPPPLPPLWNDTSHQLSLKITGTRHGATGISESVIMYSDPSLETLSHKRGRRVQGWRRRREGTCAKDSISCRSKQSEISPWWQCRRMEADCSVFSMSHIYFTKALSQRVLCFYLYIYTVYI